MCVCVSLLPLLICCLFCFLSLPSPKRFGKVQISVLTAQCSKRKGQKQKGWRRGGDGGREEAQQLAARPGWDRRVWGWVLGKDFGVWFVLRVPGITLLTCTQIHCSSTMSLGWPSLVGEGGWKNKVYSFSSCKMWAEALGESLRGF